MFSVMFDPETQKERGIGLTSLSSIACADQPAAPNRARAMIAHRLHHFFEHTCDVVPTNLALVCGKETLSYANLDVRANRLAHHLIRHGVRPGDRVGLLLERSVNTYVALLAVLKCGAAFVPLDPSFPAGPHRLHRRGRGSRPAR